MRVTGDLEARYINKADVKVQGEIRVTRQILQSQVRALGRILVPTGRAAGGLVSALAGIEVGTAGAPGATHTEFEAGIDFQLQDQMAIYYRKIEKLEADKHAHG